MSLPKILCVDDEPNVLAGLSLQLRRSGEVVTATSGADGLAAIAAHGPFALVISDMRMPNMDGATFLARARELAPDTTRMLLTGHAETAAAIEAINRGQIFRFLTKPCPPEELRSAVAAAVEQHRLITAERVLLEQTLVGSIKALTEILSMTNPLVFGKATRILQHVRDLADQVPPGNRWALEAAAMLSQLGFATLADGLVKKRYAGTPLTPEEEAAVARAPATTDALLAHIPRLEGVREILVLATAARAPGVNPPPSRHGVSAEAEILRLALDFDDLESRGLSTAAALDTLRGRSESYPGELLEALLAARSQGEARQEIREVPLRDLTEGMVFVDDVRAANGVLLLARGFRITAGFLARARNFPTGHVREPLRVIIPHGGEG